MWEAGRSPVDLGGQLGGYVLGFSSPRREVGLKNMWLLNDLRDFLTKKRVRISCCRPAY